MTDSMYSGMSREDAIDEMGRLQNKLDEIDAERQRALERFDVEREGVLWRIWRCNRRIKSA